MSIVRAFYSGWRNTRSHSRERVMISYCIAVYRPTYARQLLADLVLKTSAPFEILIWLNVADAALDAQIDTAIKSGVPLRVIGRTPTNIGMVAYSKLFG